LRASGSVIDAVIADKRSPIAYGYGDKLAVYFNQSPVFSVSAGEGFGGGGRGASPASGRPTGRGTLADPTFRKDAPCRWPLRRPGRPDKRMFPARRSVTAGAEARVVVRFAGEKDLLVSGMLAGGSELADQAAVVDVPRGQGHVLLFANNPMWRNETQGSYFLLFNAMLNFDHLEWGGRKRGQTHFPPRKMVCPLFPYRNKAEALHNTGACRESRRSCAGASGNNSDR